ncbi:MAG: hypothetical protein OQL19_02885, partial [Gammaproteobacteria bacterium]|nr:hypothetical protein [Gammaproteobacteria bacterium]
MKNIIIALLISILALSGNLYAETTENTSSETSVSQGYQGDENISGTASALMDDVWEMLEKVKAMGNKVIDMISRMGEMAEKMTDMTSRMGDVAETLEIEQDQGIESAIYLGDASDFAEEEAAQAAAAETSLPAGFFDSIFDMMVGEPIKAMSQAMAKMMEPVIDGFLGMAKKISTMASKIGLMADNILGMADKIGVMAEYILNMADRIV